MFEVLWTILVSLSKYCAGTAGYDLDYDLGGVFVLNWSIVQNTAPNIGMISMKFSHV